LARQFQVELRKIPEFQLTAQVQSSGWNSLEFEFGKQSDVELDAGYKVYEEVQGKGKTYIGYAKVRKVGDEKAQPPVSSRAQKIIQKDKIEAGTELHEYPQLLVNGYLRFGIFTLEDVDSGTTSSAYGPLVGVDYDVARFVEIPEVWLRVEGHLGVKPGDPGSFLFYGGQGGIVKKFYLRRLGLEIGAMGGYSRMSYISTGGNAYQNQYGLTVFGGPELILAPWLAVNGEFGYRIFTYSDWENEGEPVTGIDNVRTKGLIMNFGLTGMF